MEFVKAPGHFRLKDKAYLPGRCADGKMYLYLCVFADRVKLGVSANIAPRVQAHERVAGSVGDIYLILLDRAEAFRRESIVTWVLGETKDTGRKSEWLDLQRLPFAVEYMMNPDEADSFRKVEAIKRCFEAWGPSGRFLLIDPPSAFEQAA